MKKTLFHSFLVLCLYFLCPEVFMAQTPNYEIYPIPQRVSCGQGSVVFTSEINIIAESSVTEKIKTRLNEVLSRSGYNYQYGMKAETDKTNLYIGEKGSGKEADTYLIQQTDLPGTVFEVAPNCFDPYLLQINKNHPHGDIVVIGDHTGSAFYALATLEQILEQGKAGAYGEVSVQDYSYTQYRGIIEGFYGHPWSVDNRLDLLEYCKRYKLNTYVYGPKADPYHLGDWRKEYPLALTERQRYMGLITQDDLKVLSEQAQKCNVNFVWAIHPALQNGISFSGESAMAPGITAIMTKFDHMYSLGIRGFGVFIDDMTYTPSGNMQAYLADQVQKELKKKYNTTNSKEADWVCPLFFVPTSYALNFGASWNLNSLKSVDQDVVIMFTGDNVFSHIKSSSLQDMSERVGRNVTLWWNNPVNDNADDCIYMQGVTSHWKIESTSPIPAMSGLLLNPMNQAQVSKVALFGGADYAWNPSAFDEKTSWENSFKSLSDDPEIQAALRIFAENSDAVLEDPDLQSYYKDFRTQYTKGKIPVVAESLSKKMKSVHEACKTLTKLKDSERTDYRLMYKDISCWLHKLESMTGIVIRSIDIMNSNNHYSQWEDYLTVRREFNKLHTDSLYIVSSSEDSGTSTREQFYEVHPSKTFMEPFVEYIVGLLEDYAPQLPQHPEVPEIVSNVDYPENITVRKASDGISLTGLQGFVLVPDAYIGVYLNQINHVHGGSVSEMIKKRFSLEYSIDGKNWQPFPVSDEMTEMAYFRLRNTSIHAQSFDTDIVEIMMPESGSAVLTNIETNMSPYETNVIGRVADGNRNTFFWKNAAQKVGDYVTLVYDATQPVYEIRVFFTEKDLLGGTMSIDLSTNNKDWETVTIFSREDISDIPRVFSCNADGKRARYVRCMIRSVRGNEWLQLAEVEVEVSPRVAVAYDNNGRPLYLLNDRDLNNGYKAQGPGFLIYRFTENITIEKIRIYHAQAFSDDAEKPRIQLLINDRWTDAGWLDDLCTTITVEEQISPSQMKISWNEKNIPDIYEIFPEGDKYEDFVTGIKRMDAEGNSELQIVVIKNDSGVHIISPVMMNNVWIQDMSGKVIVEKKKLADTQINIPLKVKEHILLLIVETYDGELTACKTGT